MFKTIREYRKSVGSNGGEFEASMGRSRPANDAGKRMVADKSKNPDFPGSKSTRAKNKIGDTQSSRANDDDRSKEK